MKKLFVAVMLGFLSSTGSAAGITFVQITADSQGPALKAAIWTPCAKAPQPIQIGPYTLPGQRDCPIVGEKLPLVVISHGHGGEYFGHHDLAETLADAGFVVAAIDHPGDTFSDMSRATEPSEFVERPLDIKRLIDYMLSSYKDASRIEPQAIGFYGFSRGGFTGLVLAGGVPDFQHANVPCPDDIPACRQIRTGQLPQLTWTQDPRIKAFVLADPLDEFPTAATVEHISAPIQLWASEYGGDGVLPETTPALAKLLPITPEYHAVSGAAHFAFLAPCPAKLAEKAPQICADAHGFDRTAFHATFNENVLRFFRANLR